MPVPKKPKQNPTPRKAKHVSAWRRVMTRGVGKDVETQSRLA